MSESTIMSMTGYGRAQREVELGQFTVELRCVNSRFHDASVTLTRELAPLEPALRQLAAVIS